ncbi:MAG: ABC transporter ATP-binding protein [Gammaproteobacteria bacterium]|nr:ABC transporter ATP-binding protein [Gammaproteobacteria bacterium]
MLVVDSVSVNYGAIRAVQEVSLRVEEGEIVALLGPNGAGKSTLISAIAGLVPIVSGHVTLGDTEITRQTPEDITRLGVSVTPEGRRVFDDLTVGENLRLGAAIRKDKNGVAKDLEEYLEMFPVLRERYDTAAHTLSGGEQQQLAIARSLMSRPKLLMLDEPSLGLAPQLVQQIFALVGTLRDRGLTLLVVEQNAHQALAFSDRAYVLNTGRLQYSGTAAELRESDQLTEHYLGIGTGPPMRTESANGTP